MFICCCGLNSNARRCHKNSQEVTTHKFKLFSKLFWELGKPLTTPSPPPPSLVVPGPCPPPLPTTHTHTPNVIFFLRTATSETASQTSQILMSYKWKALVYSSITLFFFSPPPPHSGYAFLPWLYITHLNRVVFFSGGEGGGSTGLFVD